MDAVLKQLHAQVINLLDDLLCICPNESDILIMRVFFSTTVEPQQLMDEFIKWVYPWKEYIRTRNLDYFEKNTHIFGPLPNDKVSHFKRKLKDGTFTPEDIRVIWDYFQVFLSLMEQYLKLK